MCSRDIGNALQIAGDLEAGTVWINSYDNFDMAVWPLGLELTQPQARTRLPLTRLSSTPTAAVPLRRVQGERLGLGQGRVRARELHDHQVCHVPDGRTQGQVRREA